MPILQCRQSSTEEIREQLKECYLHGFRKVYPLSVVNFQMDIERTFVALSLLKETSDETVTENYPEILSYGFEHRKLLVIEGIIKNV